jgi:hypothetical protein
VHQDWGLIRERTVRVRASITTRLSIEPLTPLSERDVVEAERQFGVVLPDGYRQFVLHVDSGGPGPVIMRRRSRGDASWGWENDRDTDLTASATPFPDQAVFGEQLTEFCDTERPMSDPAAQSAWDEREEELLRSQTSGAIYLGEEGHGFSMLLIISGPERGNVWFDRRPTTDTIIPLRRPDGVPATLTDLYLDWLEAAERLLTAGRTQLQLDEIRSPIYETRFDT